MPAYELRILLETVEGKKTSYFTRGATYNSFIDTATDGFVMSASTAYSRLTGSVSASYENLTNVTPTIDTSQLFVENTLLSASLSGSQNTGSIVFTALDSEYDRLLRYKFIGEKVANTLGIPNDQWIYVDQIRLPSDDENNIFQGNANLNNVFFDDTITFGGASSVNSDIPFLIDTGSDRYIKFVDDRNVSKVALRMGYDVDTDTYEISGSDDFTFNIGGIDNIRGDITASGEFIFSKDTDGGNSIITIENSNTDTGTDKGAGIEFKHKDNTGGGAISQPAGAIIAGKDNAYNSSIGFNASVDSNLQFFTTLNGTDTERMRISSTGEISASGGITSSGLHTSGDISSSGTVQAGGMLVDLDISHHGDANTKIRFTDDNVSINAGGNTVDFESTGMDVSGHITASGDISGSVTSTGSFGAGFFDSKVGIGTTSPFYNLDVQGGTNSDIRAKGTSIGRLRLQNNNRHYSISTQGTRLLIFDESGGAERVSLLSDGNVGIGTTAPTTKLQVVGDISASGDVIAQNYIVKSTVTQITQSFSSGSTIFGDSNTDTHKFTGSLELTGSNLKLVDNSRLILGTGNDLQIYHSGTNSFIHDGGTGNLKILASNLDIQDKDGADYIKAIDNSGVTIYFNNSEKFQTQAGGVQITGNITASQNISGSTIEGQTLTADVFLSAPSASITNITTTNITASGNISSSENIYAQKYYIHPTKETYIGSNDSGDDLTLEAADDIRIRPTDDVLIYGTDDTIYTHFDGANKRVGIGISTPNNPLSVSGSLTVFNPNETSRLTVGEADDSGESTNNCMIIETLGASNKSRIFTKGTSNDFVIETMGNNSDIHLSSDRDIRFGVNNNSAYNFTEKMIMKFDGKFGIGTSDPTETLEIVAGGRIKVTPGTDATGSILSLANDHDVLFSSQNDSATGDPQQFVLQHNDGHTELVNRRGNLILSSSADVNITAGGDDVIIQAADDVDIKVQGGETAAKFGGNGGVDLYHNNVKKFSTVGGGIDVDGHITASGGISASGNITGNKILTHTLQPIGRHINVVDDGASIPTILGGTRHQLGVEGTVLATGDITASGNITGSIIEGQTLVADVFLSSPSASIVNLTNTNITSSGNISASGTITAASFNSFDSNLAINHLTASGNISSSGTIITDRLQYTDNTYIDFNEAGENTIRLHANGAKVMDASAGTVHINPLNSTGLDFRVDGASDYLIFADSGEEKVSIGTNALTSKLSVNGDLNVSSHITASGNISASGDISASNISVSATGSFSKILIGNPSDVDHHLNVDGHVGLDEDLHMKSNKKITWSHGDASIEEGTGVGSAYCLGFKTYDGSSNSLALLLEGNNDAKFTGNITASGNISASGAGPNYLGGDLLIQAGKGFKFAGGSATRIQESSNDLLLDADDDIHLSPDDDLTINHGGTNYVTFFGDERKFSITGDITGSTIEGQILTADVFLSAPSASLTNITNTNITASGNYSGSSDSTITIGGKLQAGSKSFLIPRPEGGKLEYGALEGQQNDVFYRGELKGDNVIFLPQEWEWLVDENTITVQLTNIGKHQDLYVKEFKENKIFIDINGMFKTKENIHCYYIIHGTRKDIELIRNYQ